MSYTLPTLQAAAAAVHAVMPPTPQYRWPLLEAAFAARPGDGTQLWLKHENHTPVGAFKIRGGLVFFHHLLASERRPAGVVSATRGNHGNSREKNAAMRALGGQVVEAGDDFQAARGHAQALAAERGWLMVPSFHPDLVAGVASYALELFAAAPDLHTVYVPIGLGSGACGLVAARDALGLATRIVGVVSSAAPAYALSIAAGRPVVHASSTVLADGMACSTPEPAALAMLQTGLHSVVQVSDVEIAAAMRRLFEATHQVAEGAGAAALAAAWQQRHALAGQRTGLILSGGNVDRDLYAAALAVPDSVE